MKAYAVLGRHRRVYVTIQSPHEETVDRMQIYRTQSAADRNAHSLDEVVEVRILIPRKKKTNAK